MKNSNYNNKFSAQFYKDISFLALVAALVLVPIACLFKSAGTIAVAAFLALGLIFTPLLLAKPAVIYIANRRVARKMKPNKTVEAIRLTLLAIFFTGAAYFIFHVTGWIAFAVFAFFAVLFAPLLLTEPAANPHTNVFLDPTYKGMPGNIWTKKDD